MARSEPPSAPEALAELARIMALLRDPESGCEWDREQTFETIAPYTIEEAYEVDDAIRRGDMNVIGMNFLSTLTSWSVEGRTLVMRTGSPQSSTESRPTTDVDNQEGAASNGDKPERLAF